MSQPTLIAADNHWALIAVVLVAAWIGVRAEQYRVGAYLSGAVVAILITFVLSNLNVLPAAAPMYDLVWAYLVPLAIPLLLFRGDLRRIVREAGPTLVAFTLGGIGTIIGTFAAFYLVPLGAAADHAWQIAGIFCATYVGGSMNFVATAQTLGLESGDLLTAAMAADQLLMILYFMVLFALPSLAKVRAWYASRVVQGGAVVHGAGEEKQPFGLERAGAALAISGVACFFGFGVEKMVEVKGSAILTITLMVVLGATLAPSFFARFDGATAVGIFFMQIFFAAIGASAKVAVVLKVGPILFLFAAVVLGIHLAFLLLMGRVLRLDLLEIVVASNANMGGPTTAAAMAIARRWQSLVIPAILCGTLGYAVATFLGTAIGYLLRG